MTSHETTKVGAEDEWCLVDASGATASGETARSTLASGQALTEADAAWLRAHQHRKVLDARVRIIGVAARAPEDGHQVRVTIMERAVSKHSNSKRRCKGKTRFS